MTKDYSGSVPADHLEIFFDGRDDCAAQRIEWFAYFETKEGRASVVVLAVDYLIDRKWDFDTETWLDEPWINTWKGIICSEHGTNTDCPHIEAAIALRYAEIRDLLDKAFPRTDPLDMVTTRKWAYSMDEAVEAVQWLYEFSEEEGFVGARQDWLFIQYAGEILGWRDDFMWEVAKELAERKLFLLNGFIVEPWHDRTSEYLAAEERTGHSRISWSDFGYWHCEDCKKSGDPQDDPADYPCLDAKEN